MTDLNDHRAQFDPAYVQISLLDVERMIGLASIKIYRRITDDPLGTSNY